MPPDGRLFLISMLASVTTVLLIVFQATWIVLTFVLRKRGRRVTYLHHNWQKIQDEIARIQSTEEREKYQRWAKGLRYTYGVWALTMTTFVLLAWFIYRS